MRKTRIKTWGETLCRSHFNRLIKLRNDDESPIGRTACYPAKHIEKTMIYPVDNTLLEQSTKMKLSGRCGALILSPLRLMRVFSERKQLYQKNKTKVIVTNETTTSTNDKNNYRIGEGGFGTVFRYVYNNRDVAIKQLHHCRHSLSSDFYSFCSELNAFRLPPSPYVVQAVAFTSSDTCLQVVTEFIEGKNLQQLIGDDKWNVTFLHRLELAFQVISGLVHCHNHLLLHLDIKAANIIVHVNGKTCKLSDFGCSKTATTSQNGLLVVDDATVNAGFGTVAYKAPELLKGQKITDRADIYSFSLLLWELLTRESVYNSLHPHIFIYNVVVHKLRPKIEQLNIPKGKHGRALVTLLENCWSDELTKRPRAITVQQIIKQFIDSERKIISFMRNSMINKESFIHIMQISEF
ncbi:other/MOS protein kinase [Wuchereria bancrofti]|uniref:non-specific serine/threonine protein kinase n=2 Tax=Wuchereria bancrofti TaxID=6293 RepID=J9EXQ2_WUCBA|nr:other/MOS protein kinase [Wuchereria bancrofti]